MTPSWICTFVSTRFRVWGLGIGVYGPFSDALYLNRRYHKCGTPNEPRIGTISPVPDKQVCPQRAQCPGLTCGIALAYYRTLKLRLSA